MKLFLFGEIFAENYMIMKDNLTVPCPPIDAFDLFCL